MKKNRLFPILLSCLAIALFVIVPVGLITAYRGYSYVPEEFKNAPSSEKGGSIYVDANDTVTMSGGVISGQKNKYGGGVYVGENGTFTMTGGTIENCIADYGGAIYVAAGGTCNIRGGHILSNFANIDGGAIYLEDGATLNMLSGSITGNRAIRNGTIYLNDGVVFTMSDGEISGNSAVDGGAIYFDGNVEPWYDVKSTEFIMNGGSVYSNYALSRGGAFGITDYGGNITLNKGEVTSNAAGFEGGAIYASDGAKLVFNGGTIDKNTAPMGSAVAMFESHIELRGVTIGGVIEDYGYVDYYDCTFTSGYIYDVGSVCLYKAPTKEIPIKLTQDEITNNSTCIYIPEGGSVSATQSVLDKIKVQNMPKNCKLAFEEQYGSQYVVLKREYEITFVNNTPTYGSVSADKIVVPEGTTWIIGERMMEGYDFFSNTETIHFSNGIDVTETETPDESLLKYNFSGWYDSAGESSAYTGTVTSNMSFEAKFYISYPVTYETPSSSLGSLRTYIKISSTSTPTTGYSQKSIEITHRANSYLFIHNNLIGTIDSTATFINLAIEYVPGYTLTGWSNGKTSFNKTTNISLAFFVTGPMTITTVTSSSSYGVASQEYEGLSGVTKIGNHESEVTLFIDKQRIGNYCCLEKKFDWQKMAVVHPKRQG